MFFVLKQIYYKADVINVIYNLLLHAQWVGASVFILNLVGCNSCSVFPLAFSNCTLKKRRKRKKEILLCSKPSVVKHVSLCSFCLPRWNKKQILHPMFQDRTCLIAQSLCCHEFCMECSSLAERPKNGFWGFFIRCSIRGWNNFLSQVFVCPWQVAGTVHLLLHRVVWNSTAATLCVLDLSFPVEMERGKK